MFKKISYSTESIGMNRFRRMTLVLTMAFSMLGLLLAFQNCGNINLQKGETALASKTCADLSSSRPENIYDDTSTDPSKVTFHVMEVDTNQNLFRSSRTFDWYLDGVFRASANNLTEDLSSWNICQGKLIEAKLNACGETITWKKTYVRSGSGCVSTTTTTTVSTTSTVTSTTVPLAEPAWNPRLPADNLVLGRNCTGDVCVGVKMADFHATDIPWTNDFKKSFFVDFDPQLGNEVYTMQIKIRADQSTSGIQFVDALPRFEWVEIGGLMVTFKHITISKTPRDFSSSAQTLQGYDASNPARNSWTGAMKFAVNDSRPSVAGKPFVRLTTGTWYINLKNEEAYTKVDHLRSPENPEGYLCGWSDVYLSAWKCGTRIATNGSW